MVSMALESRQLYGNNRCYDGYGNYTCNSGWYNWGRWVALAVIIVAAILLFFLFSCISARRRRRAGRQPMYGTGWTNFSHGPATYNPNYPAQQEQPSYQAPPAYGQQGGYYGQNQGYFGGRGTDVEMQPPQNVYGAGGDDFQPPAGPPPKKR